MDRDQAPKTHHLKNETKKEGRKGREGRKGLKERLDYAKVNDSKNRAKLLAGRVKTNRKPLL